MRYLVLPLIAGLLLGCTSSPKSFELSGLVHAPRCDGYNVLNAPVVIRNQDNTAIATTEATLDHELSQTACVVQFKTTVPRATFYQIRIGTHDGPPYSFAQLQSMNWAVDLELQ